VITIIGILAGLITGVAWMVRSKARKAVVKIEITQLQLALMKYEQDVGEIPPDFANLRHTDTAVRDAARNEVLRHLRKAFPRYRPRGDLATPANTPDDWSRFRYDVMNGDNNNGYSTIDINNFDASSAIVFWLGGLPETISSQNWKPAGFHSDPAFPFKIGTPRKDPLFTFNPGRIKAQATTTAGPIRYYATADFDAPYVYFVFRARRMPTTLPPAPQAAGQYEYGYLDSSHVFYPLSFPAYSSSNPAGTDYAVPYLDQQTVANFNTPATERVWRNSDTCQIIFAGYDGLFGGTENNFRISRMGRELPRSINNPSSDEKALNEGNFDNIANFSDVTIEDEMQK